MAEKTVPERDENLPVPTSKAEQPLATREPTRYEIPPVDIYETDDGLTCIFDVPGVTKSDLDLRVDEGKLTIRANVSREKPGTPFYEEFELLGYYRQFELSDTVDQEHISAELKHGVLTLTLPRAEHTKPKKVAIQVK